LAILAGSEHDEKSARIDRGVAKRPFERQRRVVGQSVAGEADRRRAWVVEFDPVRRIAVLVEQRSAVGGHHFVDDNALRGCGQMIMKKNKSDCG